MAYHSQFGEDRIIDALLGSDYIGTCVEVGANDGVYGSTTLHFEEKGWRSILIEPNPALCQSLRDSRSGSVFECAVSDHEGVGTLYIAEGAPHADGVSMLGELGTSTRRIERFGFTARPVQVHMRTLDSVLDEAGAAPGIDFISIDVEGHEESVLRGLSLDRWRPRILIIEDNNWFQDAAIPCYLAERGYVPFRRSGVNDWYGRIDDPQLVTASARLRYALRQSLEPFLLTLKQIKAVSSRTAIAIERRLPVLRAVRKSILR